jgi:DNA-binding response OmpR family regulator
MTTVLVADDETDLLTILHDRLVALGYDVLTARNGVEALEGIKGGRPDIVILDLMMPELNGFQVCRRVKADPSLTPTPVIMLTAKDTDADRFWGHEVGADLYLTKPMDPAQVVAHVQELLSAKCIS